METQLSQYTPVVFAFAFAATVALALVGLSALLGRGRLVQQRKRETYESGIPVIDPARRRVSIKFFVVAMVFIVFDVEIAFLYPWAVTVRESLAQGGSWVLLDGLVFFVLLAVGYLYSWRKGAFDWARRGSQS